MAPHRAPAVQPSRAQPLSGVILDSPQTALQAIGRTHTQTGLTVTARILAGGYELGRKCPDTFRDNKDKFIRHDAVLGKWNYLITKKTQPSPGLAKGLFW